MKFQPCIASHDSHRFALVFGLLLLAFGVADCAQAQAPAKTGTYTIRADKPQQIIRGLGFEIQSDSIGSGNQGMPNEVVAVPHDLTSSEKTRFYTQMLHGFRYSRLALGLYLRGTDADQKQIVERYPGQMNDLRTMQQVSGIEGFDVEYWSPAPYWKKNKSYYGGTIASTSPEFVSAFSDAMVQDLRYLRAHGLRVAQWGLQNEPGVIQPPQNATTHLSGGAAQAYATCFYSPEDYFTVLKATAPKVRALLPDVQIQTPSWDGPSGKYAAEIRKDPALLKNVDAWTWHQIGHNSNDPIDLRAKYLQGADGKPVYENEFEYQPWAKNLSVDQYFMNTGQSLMNWMVFENSPVWYWLHALKPVTNMEATGYALGFWRPAGEIKNTLRPNLQVGHWDFNPYIWNALAGFLKYLPWDATRLQVDESTVQYDQRILVWRKLDKLGIALSNRGTTPYTFVLAGMTAKEFEGHRYTLSALNQSLGTKQGAPQVSITVPPQSFEFWIAR
jgi:O-glycosyl hydrolase